MKGINYFKLFVNGIDPELESDEFYPKNCHWFSKVSTCAWVLWWLCFEWIQIIENKNSLNSVYKKYLGLKSTLIPVLLVFDILCI